MNNNKVALFADSTCDLGNDLKDRYHVNYVPLHIIIDGKDYLDNVTISADKVYEVYYSQKILPKTAAVNVIEYTDAFMPWISQGYDIVVVNIGSALSSSHQNARLAAAELPNVYPVDSCNLSTGSGLLVIRAAELIEEGYSGAQIQEKLQEMTGKSHASFILDTLAFLSAGGRCSAITAFAANLLNLKPCIRVDNTCGAMSVGKKYRGKLDSVLQKYVEDELSSYPSDSIDKSRIFITHGGIDSYYIDLVREKIKSILPFHEIFDTRASCTISSHCGPNTLGILFMTK